MPEYVVSGELPFCDLPIAKSRCNQLFLKWKYGLL